MSRLTHIGAVDRAAAAEVAAEAYKNLETISLLPWLEHDQPRTPEAVGRHGLCSEASDAVTRAAYSLGIVAARELHTGVHYITSFGKLTEQPREDDPIMCLTWGQYNLEGFKSYPELYFGARRDIRRHVSERDYARSFAGQSVLLRQVTHTPARFQTQGHVWLKTTPHDLATRTYPVGRVEPADYPYHEWEYPAKLPFLLAADIEKDLR